MKHFICIASGLLLAVLLASCAAAEKPAAVQLREFKNEDAVQASNKAKAFAGGFFQALADKDFSKWQLHFPPKDESRIDKRKFERMCAELDGAFGKFRSSGYLGELTVGDLRNYLWKMSFAKTDNNREVIREAVFFVRVYCESGKQPEISGFGVKVF